MLIEEINPFMRYASKNVYKEIRRTSKRYESKILYFLSGSGTFTVENETYKIEPNMLVMFQAGTSYSFIPHPEFKAITVDFDLTRDFSYDENMLPIVPVSEFDEKLMHPVIKFKNCNLTAPVIYRNVRSLEPYLNELCDEWKFKKNFYIERCAVILKYIIYKIVDLEYESSKANSVSDKVLKYISENYNKKITNVKIASDLNYNPCYLNRIIISATGKSLHQYVMNYRIAEALKLVTTTDLSLEEISDKTGFNDISHFSKSFKAITGNSPTYYRKNRI